MFYDVNKHIGLVVHWFVLVIYCHRYEITLNSKSMENMLTKEIVCPTNIKVSGHITKTHTRIRSLFFYFIFRIVLY